MNFLFTLVLLFLSVVVVGGIAIFCMNIASSMIYLFVGKPYRFTLKYKIGLIILTIIHAYIFLSFTSVVVLLCHACNTSSILLLILVWLFGGIVGLTTPWIAYVQAKNKLNDPDVGKQESTHVIALSLNALISSIGFFVFAFFPKGIAYGWPWVVSLMNYIF